MARVWKQWNPLSPLSTDQQSTVLWDLRVGALSGWNT